MMLTALATETHVTLCPESYTAPVFTHLLKLYCTVRSAGKKSELKLYCTVRSKEKKSEPKLYCTVRSTEKKNQNLNFTAL